tara:strand:- start:101 stop:688 length:588 start_codon:yes stop_codon:yes gene_type:complete
MKLLFENWRNYQLLTEIEDIYVLYESQVITEAEFMDRIKKWAQRKGIPLAIALSIASGVMTPPAYAADIPTEEPTEHVHDVESEDWMRFGKAVAISTKGDRFSLHHNGTDRVGDDATIVFLKGFDGPTRDYLFNGQGEVIGFAQNAGVDAKKMPLWKPHFHPPKSGYSADVSSPVEFNLDSHINSSLYELPAPGK